MLLTLSRSSFWLAAAAAGLALVGPASLAMPLTIVSVGAAGLAFGLWRAAISARQRDAALDATPPPVPLATDVLLDIAVAVSRSAAGASTFDAGLREVSRTLKLELGARELRLFDVRRRGTTHAVVAELVDGRPGHCGAERDLRLDQVPLGEAIATGRPAGDAAGELALPVLAGAEVIAVIVLDRIEMTIAPGALDSLVELARTQLSQLAQRASAAAPDEPPATDGRDEREFLRALTENLPVSLFVFEPQEHRLVALNAHAAREFGLDRERVLGQTVAQAFGAQVCAVAEPHMMQAIRERQTVERDFELATSAGVRTISARHFALRHPDGSPRLLISLARDVSAEHLARRELLDAQARYREFAETVEDSLFVSNPQRSQFEFIAGSAFDTWGITPEQFAQRNDVFLDNVVEEDRHILDERRQRELRQENADIVFRIRHPQKGLRWLRSRTRTRVLADGGLRVYGRVSDATDDRLREAELERARDAAEAASRAKSQFMATMSHEIRTPMNGILGMTELLLGTTLSDKQRRFAQAVYRSGESLLEIINDILDFSKIEAGRLELAPSDFVLRALIEDTLELLAPRAHQKGLELSFREEPGLPAVVHGDPLRLRQVLTNLVANAIKFTEHGDVVVDLRRAPDEACPSGVTDDAASLAPICLEFGVRDTGIGITADVLPRLFSAFTQAHGGMSRRYGGTGLGLAISRQLVELMGGRIDVRSAPGLGSDFRFSVPLRAAASDTVPGDGNEADLSGLQVLVVDDNETNRAVLENMLGAWGMNVTLAEDGEQALHLLRSGGGASRFDLALVDMHMPRLDGIGLARALAGDATQAAMKLILLSSVSSPDDVRVAQQAGYQRFVAKPVRKAELRQAILGVTLVRAEAGVTPVRLGLRVLVVEDNVVNQEVIGQMLRRLGCELRVAAGAMDGLRALCEERFDLVLMDIQMPGMDGVEALRWFRHDPTGRFRFLTQSDTPVVAVTANALDEDEERFLDHGFDDYLSKPFRQNQLLAMLTRRLRLAAPVAPDDAPEPGAAPAAVPPAGGTGSGLLDAQALDRLRELDPKGENKLLERVLKAFETSVARLVPQLTEAQGLGDRAGIRHVAHTLKSSSASIGALHLSHQCAEIEAMIRLDKVTDLDARVDAMRAEVAIVLQALRQLLDGTP